MIRILVLAAIIWLTLSAVSSVSPHLADVLAAFVLGFCVNGLMRSEVAA